MSTTIVWCTHSVDTSAIFLAQAVDAEIAVGSFAELTEELRNIIREPETKIIFYGLVDTEGVEIDETRMFNLPSSADLLAHRQAFLTDVSTQHELLTGNYRKIVNRNYTSMRDFFGSTKFDILAKSGDLLAVIKNATDYNQATTIPSATFACNHIDRAGFDRVFVGHDIMGNNILGRISSSKKLLSHKETLMLNRSEEVKTALTEMFEKGLITEDTTKAIVAWSEQQFVKEGIDTTIMNIAKILQNKYRLDFAAVDLVSDKDGRVFIMNATCSPSLQDSEVLFTVSDYFRNILRFGRKFSKESLLNLIGNISDDNAKKAADLLKEAGLINLGSLSEL